MNRITSTQVCDLASPTACARAVEWRNLRKAQLNPDSYRDWI